MADRHDWTTLPPEPHYIEMTRGQSRLSQLKRGILSDTHMSHVVTFREVHEPVEHDSRIVCWVPVAIKEYRGLETMLDWKFRVPSDIQSVESKETHP